MVLPVHGAHLVEQRSETRHLLARVLVMSTDDVRDQVGQRLGWPVTVLLDGARRLFGYVERVQHLVHREIRRAAGFFKGFVAAAAIVDAQLFKHSGRGGVFQGQFPYGFLSGDAHEILLVARSMPHATLDIPKVAERRSRADDFCHGDRES